MIKNPGNNSRDDASSRFILVVVEYALGIRNSRKGDLLGPKPSENRTIAPAEFGKSSQHLLGDEVEDALPSMEL